MTQFNEHHTFNGMQRDIDIALHPSNFLYEAHNIRLTAREEDTLLAITNEAGTKDLGRVLQGAYLGHCLINEYLVVFTTETGKDGSVKADRIYRVNLSMDDPEVIMLYGNTTNRGDLGFDMEYPIEAIGSYENDNVQKVYWTDNLNQPRVINITPESSTEPLYSEDNPTRFDFVPSLTLGETVHVEKLLAGNGVFAPGVIQYALTYYYKYGQESNIFHITPMAYISFKDRGASPEDKVDNAFRITVENPDTRFDYLRIYSIQRTSINGTPVCRRVQDIYIRDLEEPKVSFIDNGSMGDSVDPTELLYKGGEEITARTLEQKDNTLFFGNIGLKREPLGSIKQDIQDNFRVSGNLMSSNTHSFRFPLSSTTDYVYGNQLSATDSKGYSVPCSGFKGGETYRLGIQFQHKSGRWSEPVYIGNHKVGDDSNPLHSSFTQQGNMGIVTVPCFIGKIPKGLGDTLIGMGYIRARALYVSPTPQDRTIVCQGVLNPAVVKGELNNTQDPSKPNGFIQSSWFFRPKISDASGINGDMMVSPKHFGYLPYTDSDIDIYNPELIRSVEIQGDFDRDNQFNVLDDFGTLHSPDFEFDSQYQLMQFNDLEYRTVGYSSFLKTLSDINIQTETPQISSAGSGFVHKMTTNDRSFGIVSGLFYDDFFADEEDPGENEPLIRAYPPERAAAKWMVYTWQKNGSLNNDINRPAYAGIQSAVLRKKVISNLRYADTVWKLGDTRETSAALYSSDEAELLKTGDYFYMGNVDTLLNPDDADGSYFAYKGYAKGLGDIYYHTDTPTPFDSLNWFKTFSLSDSENNEQGLYHWDNPRWSRMNFGEGTGNIGDGFVDLVRKKEPVRMKYKSSPHLIMSNASTIYDETIPSSGSYSTLPVVELYRTGDIVRYGGETPDALRGNTWIPCGDSVAINNSGSNGTELRWTYGDTYFQRWDCLKTYPFTREDPNQVVEIGSFMLETHVNIDGRYDRNRGQIDNTNMSPQNFNLFNPVYSQQDNFFTYRILDEDYYRNTRFPNQVTWSKEKQSGADTDLWANVTLASTWDMDGAKGEIVSLNTWRDSIFCFQRKGVGKILFNSRVQIPTSDNVPIEITNSYKVDGYRYLSEGMGCSDARQVRETPAGVYFIDTVTDHLLLLGDSVQDITQTHNMSSWFRQLRRPDFGLTRLMYDEPNKDLYLVNSIASLCFSEVLGQFTSFMDYQGINLMESYGRKVFSLKPDGESEKLWQLFAEGYNYFFGNFRPWSITFVSNGASNGHQDMDKIFTNIDYRMDMVENISLSHDSSLDYMRVWNEYQDTENVDLKLRKGLTTGINLPNSILQKKFRIWRIQVPRSKGTVDRIRNTWCRITLGCRGENSRKAILHDLNVQYYT